jgi:23S rRNA (cytosine1962-C5)-methyltransferase
VDPVPTEIFAAALAARAPWLARWHAEQTDGYRLLHGAVEGAPGVTVDRYGPVLLVQTWGDPLPAGRIDALGEIAAAAVGAPLVPVWNHRAAREPFERWHVAELPHDRGLPEAPIVRELGATFDARPRHRGIDPLLFLDLRAVRRRLRTEASGRSVLNLFAYTAGVGVAAALGGATEVWNVDFSRSAAEVGAQNAERNGVGGVQRFVREDCLAVLRQLAGVPVGRRGQSPRVKLRPRTFDLVVLDPPPWAKGRFGAVDLVRDYASLFKPAVLCAAPGGVVVATNNVASVDRDGWLEGLVRCASKAGRPLGEVEVLLPEADFPSPDGRPPLKIAWCSVP